MEVLSIWVGLHVCVTYFLPARVFFFDCDVFAVVVAFVVAGAGTVGFSVVGLLDYDRVMYLAGSWLSTIVICSIQNVSKSISREPWWIHDTLT